MLIFDCAEMSRSQHKRARSVRDTRNPNINPVRCANKTIEAEYTKHYSRTHQATRWYHEPTGREMFMHEAIGEAFGYINASSILALHHPSYEALTSEFLSALTTTIKKPSDGGQITFCLGNKRRVLNLQQWNDIFGFANTQDEVPKEFNLKRFWGRLTGSHTIPSAALPGKQIASPLFRVILKILGNTIWARKESSRPLLRELICLYLMLYNAPFKMNMGHELLVHLLGCKKQTGELCIGGMVTHIAVHFGVDLTQYSSQGPTFIDRHYLILAKLLELKNNRLGSKWNDRYTRLAAPLMVLLHVPNWYESWARSPLHPDLKPGSGDHDSEYLRICVNAPGGEADDDEEEEEEGDDEEGYEGMDMEPTYHGASGSGTAPEYPAYYTDMCTRMDGLQTGVSELKTELGDLRRSQDAYQEDQRRSQNAYQEEQARLANERWKKQEDFMAYYKDHQPYNW